MRQDVYIGPSRWHTGGEGGSEEVEDDAVRSPQVDEDEGCPDDRGEVAS